MIINHEVERQFVQKEWGEEEIIVNTHRYCGKILRIAPGKQCSLHYHLAKAESFLCLVGPIDVRLGDEFAVLQAGDSLDVPTGTPHRFAVHNNFEMGVLIEFSTAHNDNDVVRLEPSGDY